MILTNLIIAQCIYKQNKKWTNTMKGLHLTFIDETGSVVYEHFLNWRMQLLPPIDWYQDSAITAEIPLYRTYQSTSDEAERKQMHLPHIDNDFDPFAIDK
jgi:hypothetical protein